MSEKKSHVLLRSGGSGMRWSAWTSSLAGEDDPEATTPVAPEEAVGLVVEREEAVVAADDH